MAIVVNFGSEISYVVFDKNKAKDYVRVGSCDLSVLACDSLKAILGDMVEGNHDFLNEPVYVTLSAGSGVVYKTFSIAQESIMVNGSRTTTAEKQAETIELVKKHLPFGLEGDYVATIMSEYKADTDYVLSCAYFPVAVLNNIRQVFSELKVSLLDVQPLVFGVYKSLDVQRFKQLIVDCGDEFMLINSLGIIVWAKPSNYNEDIAKQFLIAQSQASYGIDPEIAETFFADHYRLSGYMLPGFVNEAGSDVLGVCAFGLLGKVTRKKSKKGASEDLTMDSEPDDYNMIPKNKKGGGLKDVIAKLRLLFNGKGEE